MFRKKRKDKIPNLVASYDHAMGAAGTILTPYLQGSTRLEFASAATRNHGLIAVVIMTDLSFNLSPI